MGRVGVTVPECQPGNLPVIGVYGICNTGSVLVHEIDYGEDRVLASINGIRPEWCGITEKENDDGEWESGFVLGSFFIPFSQVMRMEV